MTTIAVLATGPSMSQEIADFVRSRCRAIAVCNAYQLAPWADALVCGDRAWWRVHSDALAFAGRKFCAAKQEGTELLKSTIEFAPGTNSGLQAMRVARDYFGATRILLCGFDMHGSHYFGAHPAPLRNTSPPRFRVHINQFKRWRGPCEVLNCTPGSALKQFPFAELAAVLADVERAA